MPLTVGGGIRAFTDAEGKAYSALDVAAEYFRSGADKVIPLQLSPGRLPAARLVQHLEASLHLLQRTAGYGGS